MGKEIRKVAELSISEGKLDEFKDVAVMFIERVKSSEPNTLSYDWFLNDDKSRCVILERYKDSEALMVHLANIRNLYGPLFEVAEISRVQVFGDPSEEVRQAHLPGTEFLDHWAGIAR
jgi:quinol monooxygenase YgiN